MAISVFIIRLGDVERLGQVFTSLHVFLRSRTSALFSTLLVFLEHMIDKFEDIIKENSTHLTTDIISLPPSAHCFSPGARGATTPRTMRKPSLLGGTKGDGTQQALALLPSSMENLAGQNMRINPPECSKPFNQALTSGVIGVIIEGSIQTCPQLEVISQVLALDKKDPPRHQWFQIKYAPCV